MSAGQPVALIFRMLLLPLSETFIHNQVAALKSFKPFYVGMKRVDGLEIPHDDFWVANRGGILGKSRSVRFKLFGPGSSCLNRLRTLQPKILHAHFGPDACEAMPLALDLNIPMITTFHGYDATRTDATFRQTIQGRRYLSKRSSLASNSALFLTDSDFLRTRILQQGFPPDRTFVHYIGVDMQRFYPPESQDRKRQVLFVGRLVEKKGCSFVIKAMAAVQAVLPDVELIIIGDGPERQQLEKAAAESLRNYRFLGKQSSSVVKQWMREALLFCVPSITASDGDAEGLPTVIVEAMASGLPVVSFSSAGIPEVVTDGKTGFLSPERDWRTLTKHLLLLLENNDLRERFSRAGRHKVEQDFDLHNQTARLERHFEAVMTRYQMTTECLSQRRVA